MTSVNETKKLLAYPSLDLPTTRAFINSELSHPLGIPLERTEQPQPFRDFDKITSSISSLTAKSVSIQLVVPTGNQWEMQLLESIVKQYVYGTNYIVYAMQVPSKSNKGIQHYNDAGLIGAHDQIQDIIKDDYTINRIKATIWRNEAAHLIFGSIQSFINMKAQAGGLKTGSFHEAILFYNARTEKTAHYISTGYPVPTKYLNAALTLGYQQSNPRYGWMAVRSLIAANLNNSDLNITNIQWEKEANAYWEYIKELRKASITTTRRPPLPVP